MWKLHNMLLDNTFFFISEAEAVFLPKTTSHGEILPLDLMQCYLKKPPKPLERRGGKIMIKNYWWRSAEGREKFKCVLLEQMEDWKPTMSLQVSMRLIFPSESTTLPKALESKNPLHWRVRTVKIAVGVLQINQPSILIFLFCLRGCQCFIFIWDREIDHTVVKTRSGSIVVTIVCLLKIHSFIQHILIWMENVLKGPEGKLYKSSLPSNIYIAFKGTMNYLICLWY